MKNHKDTDLLHLYSLFVYIMMLHVRSHKWINILGSNAVKYTTITHNLFGISSNHAHFIQ